ncbi:MAG: flippase-like domain-containing protein [Oscillospiraceae bacterium]|jgi:uncharacterized protein (TIRG00374 family)|nr:flippase-like domain-containing protein [Oscillospiraceae bacterium]
MKNVARKTEPIELRRRQRKIIGVTLFILMNAAVIATTAYVDFGGDHGNRPHLADINALYLLGAFGCFVVTLCTETLKYYLMLNHLKSPKPMSIAFKVAALGKYYDNITPFGSGGQPFQFLFLKKQKVPTGTSSALPIAGFISMQAGFILIAIIVFIFGKRLIDNAAVSIAAAIGFVFYIFMPLTLAAFAIFPRFMCRAIEFFARIGHKLRLVKDPKAVGDRALGMLIAFREGLSSILHHRILTLQISVLSIIYNVAMCSIPYFVLKMFGSDLSYASVFCTTIFIYLCVTFVPTPGNSGVAEGSFFTLFSVIGVDHMFWAMLLWRFFCYYSYIITGLIVLWHNAAENRRHPPE